MSNPFYPVDRENETVEFHTRIIEKVGIDKYERSTKKLGGRAKLASRKAIQIYKENQLLDADIRREEREIEGVEAAKEANRIAEEANRISKNAKRISWLAIGISALTVVVMMAIAISEKSA